jgi:PncC family amidohydrolase
MTTEAERLAKSLAARGLTIATAESMTGGAVGEALVVVPGSGEWLAGGVIAYMSRVKFDVLGVTPGPVVSERAAREMAAGVARLLGTDVGIATTGCAGPEPMEGQPVGTLWVGVADRGDVTASHHLLPGGPEAIRVRAVEVALDAATDWIARS